MLATTKIGKTLYNSPMDEALMRRVHAIADQFTTEEATGDIAPFGNGRINDTYLVTTESGGRYILQKQNPIFAPSVLEDIAAMTGAMKERGFRTTELLSTKKGDLGIVENNECWRMLTYIEGRTIEEGVSIAEAASAMELIGNFHHAFSTHEYQFRHVRGGFHDTPKIFAELKNTVIDYRGTEKGELLADLGNAIMEEYRSRGHAWVHLPKRIIHGDPKLNNVRFANDSSRAIALLDLDTLGRQSVVIDIADAARSWCNRADEGDEAHAKFDLAVFQAMMAGYLKAASFLTEAERAAIPEAIAHIALELSARFLTDAYKETYFRLDPERYPDLLAQNSAKARAQFALYRDIKERLVEIASLTKNLDSTAEHWLGKRAQ